MIKMLFSFQLSWLAVLAFWPLNQPNHTHIDWYKQSMPMCHTENTGGDMRDFALDPDFQALHPAPHPFTYAAQGVAVSFATPDGQMAKGYMLKAKKKSNKWLFVFQEWWGLNDYIKAQSDLFYADLSENVNVLAIDMYDGQVATDPKEAGKLMSETKEVRLENIVKGAVAFAGKKARIAHVGWCFGGSWSLKSAIIAGPQTIGSVMYYGMPVKDIDKLKTLNSDVLGLFATETRISKTVIEEFAANMATAGKSLNYKIFEGAHGFANPSNPKHDAALAKEAYGLALGYLKNKFKLK